MVVVVPVHHRPDLRRQIITTWQVTEAAMARGGVDSDTPDLQAQHPQARLATRGPGARTVRGALKMIGLDAVAGSYIQGAGAIPARYHF